MKTINRYKINLDKYYSIKLNSNESFKTISEEFIIEAINELKEKKFNRYPDTDCEVLKECYGKVVGVKSDNIIVGNGSDEMIALVIGAVITKGKTVFTIDPDFSMYDFYTTCNEGQMVKFQTNRNGSFLIKDFIKKGIESNPHLIIISNPNNPTGYALNIKEIKQIIQAFPRSKIVIDEAYYEFYGQTAITLINEFSNLIITRTLSKAWGLASLRVGFLISNRTLIRDLYRYKVPYNVNEISQHIASMTLQYPQQVLNNVMEVIEERERLYNKLYNLEKLYVGKINIYKSKGNFIFGRTPYLRYLRGYMEMQGVLIRYFNDDSFRITVGSPLENDLVVTIINNALEDIKEDYDGKKCSSS